MYVCIIVIAYICGAHRIVWCFAWLELGYVSMILSWLKFDYFFCFAINIEFNDSEENNNI